MEPREWLKHPMQFGKVREAQWKPTPADPKMRAVLAASYWQHSFVCDAEAERLAQQRTWTQVAKRAGIDSGTLGKVIRGNRPMTLAVMIGVVRSLRRIEVLPSPLSLEDLLPGR